MKVKVKLTRSKKVNGDAESSSEEESDSEEEVGIVWSGVSYVFPVCLLYQMEVAKSKKRKSGEGEGETQQPPSKRNKTDDSGGTYTCTDKD